MSLLLRVSLSLKVTTKYRTVVTSFLYHHIEVKPIVDYTPYALNRVRYVRELWDLPLEERKRMAADCLEIPQDCMGKKKVYYFQRCVRALTRRILSEVLDEEESDQLALYMQIVRRILENKTHPIKVSVDAISVEEKKQLFLVYEAVSMAVRLASSPFSLLHLPVDSFFLKVGLNGWIEE